MCANDKLIFAFNVIQQQVMIKMLHHKQQPIPRRNFRQYLPFSIFINVSMFLLLNTGRHDLLPLPLASPTFWTLMLTALYLSYLYGNQIEKAVSIAIASRDFLLFVDVFQL